LFDQEDKVCNLIFAREAEALWIPTSKNPQTLDQSEKTCQGNTLLPRQRRRKSFIRLSPGDRQMVFALARRPEDDVALLHRLHQLLSLFVTENKGSFTLAKREGPGSAKATGRNLKLVWAKFSTTS
jgi:hypothetical protein